MLTEAPLSTPVTRSHSSHLLGPLSLSLSHKHTHTHKHTLVPWAVRAVDMEHVERAVWRKSTVSVTGHLGSGELPKAISGQVGIRIPSMLAHTHSQQTLSHPWLN
jgi:hypothetical protein